MKSGVRILLDPLVFLSQPTERMEAKGYKGSFSYSPEYSCEEEDYEAIKEMCEGMGVTVSHVSPIVDLDIGSEFVVLIKASRREPAGSISPKLCMMLVEDTGRKLFRVVEKDVPDSQEQFAKSFKEQNVGGNTLIKKRANLWTAAHEFQTYRDSVADYVLELDEPAVHVLDERENEDGSLELDIRYNEKFADVVAEHYGVEEPDKELVTRFMTEALEKRTDEIL